MRSIQTINAADTDQSTDQSVRTDRRISQFFAVRVVNLSTPTALLLFLLLLTNPLLLLLVVVLKDLIRNVVADAADPELKFVVNPDGWFLRSIVVVPDHRFRCCSFRCCCCVLFHC